MIRLGDDVMARDAQIATLQNTKNELEEEVFRLHSSLDKVINTGEQMRDFGLEKIDTLQNIEAHRECYYITFYFILYFQKNRVLFLKIASFK